MNVETIAIPAPDDFYEAFCLEHEALTPTQSAAFNIRLVFLLANQIADQERLRACLEAARDASA